MWQMEHMIIVKASENSGTASIKLADDQGTTLFINNIIIDLSNGANAIGIAKVSGTPVVSGTAVDDMKQAVLEAFQEGLVDVGPGMYRIDADGVESI